MTKITLKKHIIMMCIIASSVYFTSYITRVNYNTVLVEISSDENILRSLLALPLTASFITYGLGQIISGCLGDRYDPFHRENPRFCVNLIFGLHKPFIKLYQNPYPCKG